MHMNGTYRAHWADRLGLCKGGGAPLAFGCIKGMGGPVPSTLIGVTRIYPVLYKERLSNGGFIVRSERMEAKMIQLYKQR
ncbi:protein BREAST CANCER SUSCEPTIBILITY 2 homolog B-like [Camellia sinensis]|uniref:protein BREAST CANCER SUSCEPTIBILITY 2 homolog B-like n=1 Tax=Camellia sinensis TaxID=4442 RepID=UPI001036801D|nr:protein BREAST CANCER SUSCEPTIBILITY 2 homolog B-like [Camellia sinensis]